MNKEEMLKLIEDCLIIYKPTKYDVSPENKDNNYWIGYRKGCLNLLKFLKSRLNSHIKED